MISVENQQKLLRQEFASVEEFVKNWLRVYLRETPNIKRLFLGNSSFMDLSELLREADAINSTPCAIFDTDITSTLVRDSELEQHTIVFHVCVRANDALNNKDVEDAKHQCLHIINEFRKFYLSAKRVHNKNCLTLEEATQATTEAPFLDGWQSMSIGFRYVQPFCCVPTWAEYK